MNTARGEQLVALLCLGFCIFYGVSAMSIDVFPGSEAELVTSRTFPYLLTVLGSVCCFGILFSALRKAHAAESDDSPGPYQWSRCVALVGIAVAYAALMTHLGFVLSTVAFIAAGSLLLGERRIAVIIAASVIPPVIFWLLLELGLDIKLPALDILGG